MTIVIFKKFEGEVAACFPTIAGDMSRYTMACYAHVGQHGVASEEWVREAKPAKPNEYAALLSELQSIGYEDLAIRRRLHPRYRDIRAEQLES